jgi:recombination protein U
MQEHLGAAAFVCVGIDNRAVMVPWSVFSNMKDYFGRKYATADDVSPYEVVQDMCIRFLEYKK